MHVKNTPPSTHPLLTLSPNSHNNPLTIPILPPIPQYFFPLLKTPKEKDGPGAEMGGYEEKERSLKNSKARR